MFNVGEVLAEGWANFKANVGRSILMALIVFGVIIVMSSVSLLGMGLVGSMVGDNLLVFVMFMGINQLVNLLVGTFLLRGVLVFSLRVIRDEPAELGDLFPLTSDGLVLPLIIVQILVSIAVSLGCLLFIIPGLLIGLLTSLSVWFVVDEELDAISAIKASIQACKGSIIPLFLWWLVMSVLVLSTSGLGLFVVFPILVYTWGHIYLQIG